MRHISHGRIFQGRFPVGKHPPLEVQEVFPGRALIGQDGAETVEILIAATPPGAVRQGQDARV